jgi:hypothetical protein
MKPALSRRSLLSVSFSGIAALLSASACGDGVRSDEEARRAYLGLDTHIDKAITLGFAGFNAASSANIPAQMTTGAAGGTLTISGQVDQGSSSNKGMRLLEELVMYSDDGKLVYATLASAKPALDMQLKSIPNGTLSGTLSGKYNMTGELTGEVTLTLSFAGQLQPSAADMTKVERKPGTTRITGTATSPAGTYQVDVTR